MKTDVMTVQPSIRAIRVAKIMVSRTLDAFQSSTKMEKLVGVVDREDIAKLVVK